MITFQSDREYAVKTEKIVLFCNKTDIKFSGKDFYFSIHVFPSSKPTPETLTSLHKLFTGKYCFLLVQSAQQTETIFAKRDTVAAPGHLAVASIAVVAATSIEVLVCVIRGDFPHPLPYIATHVVEAIPI